MSVKAEGPLISVVMAVYNGEKYLHESVQSILDQTCTDFEFIIVNDGSRDGTGAILDKFLKSDKRIRIIHQENQGLAQSLNNAIQVAKGKFIARMDDDDIAHPNRLTMQSRKMLQDSRIGLCQSLYGLVDEHGQAVPFRNRAGFRFSHLQMRWTLIWQNCICHPSVMIRRAVLEKHQIYYDPLVICQDYDLWCRLIEVTEFQTILMPLLLLRKHSGSVSAHYNEKYLATFSGIIAKNLKKYAANSIDPHDLRTITLISGQMYLRGKYNTEQIDVGRILKVFGCVTSNFIEVHCLTEKEAHSIQKAAGQQLFRWAQQAWYHNKTAAARLLLAGLGRYVGVQSDYK